MAQIDLGRLRFAWQGAWDNATAYEQNDVVTNSNVIYVGIATSIPAGTVTTNTSYWAVMLDTSTFATDSDITTAVNAVIDSAPGALDTLNELAAALGDDASFSTTVTNSLATKAPLTSADLVTPNLQSASETVTIAATAATGTVNVDINTSTVHYYTSNASADWTFNFRGDGSTTLDSMLATGESITVAFLVTNGGTAYYPTAFTVDGSSVTPKWQGGSAPSAGNATSVDAYVFSIVKTGSAAFTVFGSQTQFA